MPEPLWKSAELINDQLEAGNWPRTDLNRQALKIAEEAGEFIAAFNRWNNNSHRTGDVSDVAYEMADLVITTYCLADSIYGIDLDRAIAMKLDIVLGGKRHES